MNTKIKNSLLISFRLDVGLEMNCVCLIVCTGSENSLFVVGVKVGIGAVRVLGIRRRLIVQIYYFFPKINKVELFSVFRDDKTKDFESQISVNFYSTTTTRCRGP